ncbi:thyroid receptor-interacting protein 11-like [Hetaerina americana]|uniref:thyroid receptor-interacting protein 11-like n=1 Tax=Hetaerina americana TaxID=62018 RepID=UPI003A7F17F9
MAWLGEGLSSLKGQITNFTKEVLSEVAEGREEGCGHESQLLDAEEKIQRLESLCSAKDLEISRLREQNAALETQAIQSQYQSKKQQPLLYHVGSTPNLGGNFTFGDVGNVKREVAFDFSSMEAEKDDLVDYLRAEIRALKLEKEKVEKKMEVFQKKCSCSEINPETTDKASAKDGLSSYGVNNSEGLYSKIQKSENSIEELKADLSLPFQENKIPSGELESFDGDPNLINFHMDKQPPVHFNNMKNLDDTEKRMSADEDITCVRNVPGIEPDGHKLMDARGECDGSEEIPKDVVKLMDQISKLTASLSDAQLNVNQHQENEKKYLQEIERLKGEELMAKDSLNNLTLQLDTAQDYNYQLEQKLEELDKQNTATIEQLMNVVSSVKHENEDLQSELKELEKKSQSLECELQSCSLNSKTMHREIELELEREVLKFIPPELIPREPKTNGSREVSVVVGAVKGLSKAFEEHKWKKDAMERKLTEMMKEAREVKAECLKLRSEINRRDNSSGLRTEGLPPILETGEEEDEDDEASESLSKDSQPSGNDGTCQGNDICDGSEPNWQRRCLVLEEEISRLKSECASGRKDSELFDDDDEDGTEEVDDWTWQGPSVERLLEAKNVSLVNNLFVKDGEHVITTISNDLEVVNPLQSTRESNGSGKSGVPTLTEQYIKEKSKLESMIAELREQKSTLEAAQENSIEKILKMEDKISALSEDLDAKAKSIMDSLDEERKLKGKLSEYETKVVSLEKLLNARNSNVEELEAEIASLNSNLLNERRCGDKMKKSILELKDEVSKLETIIKSKEDFYNEKAKEINILEERQKFLEQNLEEESNIKEEHSKLVSYLEGKVASLQVDLEQECKLKEEAHRDLNEFKEKNQDLDNKLVYEVQLKEEALRKLTDVEERFHAVQQSVHQELMSKNEFSNRIIELEKGLIAAEEEAKLDRILKDEAVIRASEQEEQLKGVEKELLVARRSLEEKDQCVVDLMEKIKALEMERESIMCVVGDKAREISSLRSERQRLMEAMSSVEKMRQKEMLNGSDSNAGSSAGSPGMIQRDGSTREGTDTPPGEKEAGDLEDDGTIQLLAKLKNLQSESEQLAESYRQEQQRNKHLQNEVHEMLEKETALQDELQRLRLHLVSVEDRYTKEAVNAEERIAFLKNKLTQVEERLHASSSAYTSASVRSNQQVESLENQIRALTEKKDESKSRLMAVEELLTQQAKDLTNLQTVLEQFQKDKDREISVVKDKMGVEISSLENKCSELSDEIVSLKGQLDQAKEGLSAAARLSEQADKKSEIITSLKTELKKLNASLISAEERLRNASLSVEGKVDKNLVKNLLLGYLSSPMQGNRRYEILRIIVTILEFNKEEKERVDLGDGPGKGTGWLRGLAGWSGGHQSKDGSPAPDLNQPSLSEAFIRFLESESRPKSVPQLRMISDARIEPVRSSSPASGHSRTPSTSSTPPLLLSESVLPTLPTFSVASGSNSSCILKDVLKDS